MTSQHDRHHDAPSTSRDYEREAEHTRRRLADNLDELSDRLTPGQLFDEMLTYPRAGGGTFFRAFTSAMRENPLHVPVGEDGPAAGRLGKRRQQVDDADGR